VNHYCQSCRGIFVYYRRFGPDPFVHCWPGSPTMLGAANNPCVESWFPGMLWDTMC